MCLPKYSSGVLCLSFIRRIVIVALSISLITSSFAIGLPHNVKAENIDYTQLVNTFSSYYHELTPAEKNLLKDARTFLQGQDNNFWKAKLGLNDFIPQTGTDSYGATRTVTADDLANLVKDFVITLYGIDAQFETNLLAFRNNQGHIDTFKIAFGDDYTLQDLFDILVNAQDEAVQGVPSFFLGTPLNTILKDAITASVGSEFSGKLSSVGLSVDQLIGLRSDFENVTFTSGGATKTLGQARDVILLGAARQFITVTGMVKNGTQNLTVGTSNTLNLKVTIPNLITDFPITSIVDWSSSSSAVTISQANDTVTITGATAGQSSTIEGRYNNILLVSGTINVVTATTGGVGPGGAGGSTGASPITDAITEEVTTDTNGSTTTTVTLDLDKFKEFVNALTNSAVNIKVSGTSDKVSVQLPVEALTALASKNNNAILQIESSNGTYSLPVKVINTANLATQLGVSADDVTVTVNINKVTAAVQGQMDQSITGLGAKSLTSGIEFEIVASANGKSIIVNNFGNVYVSRSLTVDGTVDASTTTGVLYNPSTGSLQFVPTTFATVNGQTVATLKRNANSIYTVVEHKKSFQDISANHWGKADIELLASKFVINGLTADTFGTDVEITRAQFTALLVRALGLSEQAGEGTFSDVSSKAWYAAAVSTAAELGLVEGFNDGTFKPEQVINRQELAVLMKRALEFVGKDVKNVNVSSKLNAFSDKNSISNWAADAVAQVSVTGITTGKTVNGELAYAPQESATRAEAAVMLKRLLQYVEFINAQK
jgi:hypothetical protein